MGAPPGQMPHQKRTHYAKKLGVTKQKRKAPPKQKPKKKMTFKTFGKGLLCGLGITAAVTVLAVPFLLGGWALTNPGSWGSGGSSTNQDQSDKGDGANDSN